LDAVRFTVLNPEWQSYNLPELKDSARTCVLKIDAAAGSVLLPADIEQGSEMHLLRTQREALRADVPVARIMAAAPDPASPFSRRLRRVPS
jgi:competence protein ComEC